MAERIAIVAIHGIGEQVPMATLSNFIESVWTTDLTLVSSDKPHPETDGDRTYNAAWYKPDPRTRNFDLRLVTAETYQTAAGGVQGTVPMHIQLLREALDLKQSPSGDGDPQ